VHCDLCVQRLASSKPFRNNSTAINQLQWKKYAGFRKLLDEKIKQQIVAVLAEKLPSRLPDSPQWIKQVFENYCFNPLSAELNPICHLLALLGAHHIFHVSGLRVNQGQILQHLCIYVHGCIACGKFPD